MIVSELNLPAIYNAMFPVVSELNLPAITMVRKRAVYIVSELNLPAIYNLWEDDQRALTDCI